MITWLGQEPQSPEDAAGQAAYDRAQQSAWPPTEEDFRATGAAAGAAVGTYFGGAVGAAVGSAVGAAVGSFVYGVGDAIASGLDPNAGAGDAPLFMQHVRHVVAIEGLRAARLLRLRCSTSIKEEIAALQRWGAPINDDGYMSQEVAQAISAAMRGTVPPGGGAPGIARAQPLVADFQKAIFAANAARIAECETLKKQAPPSKSSSSSGALPVVIGAAAIAGVAWWLLA